MNCTESLDGWAEVCSTDCHTTSSLSPPTSLSPGPVLTPSTNQTVPDNLASNVSYECVIPSSPNLRLFWEVDNLQLQSAEIVQRFQDRGIVKQDSPAGNESTLIVTEQVRVTVAIVLH